GRSPYQVLFGRLPHVPDNGRYYDIGQLYAIWDEVRIVQGETFRKNKLYYDARRHAEQRDQNRYVQGQAVLLYLKRSAALGVPNKLGDAWEPGWKIVRGPDERYPSTAVIVNGSRRKVINLRYLLVDTRVRCDEEADGSRDQPPTIPRSPNVVCEIVCPDEDGFKVTDYALNESDDEQKQKSVEEPA
ncbi:hypothetical protein FOZ62_004271, partial [Perkinsus olseni]